MQITEVMLEKMRVFELNISPFAMMDLINPDEDIYKVDVEYIWRIYHSKGKDSLAKTFGYLDMIYQNKFLKIINKFCDKQAEKWDIE